MKPCDCKSEQEIKKLDIQGIGHNEWSLSVNPNIVLIENRYFGTVKVPMKLFKQFAEWYLEEQL